MTNVESESDEMEVEEQEDVTSNVESDNEEAEAHEEQEKPTTSANSVKKPTKRGIIYLSSIPPYMNVSKIKEIFDQFGTVGRVYLQLADTEPKPGDEKKKSKKRKVAKKFTEGWVEFERKSVAKKVVQLLNNKQVSNKKSSKHYDCIWNIKYLSGFKWTHLHERLAYEKAARRQKLRVEIQLSKKKTNFFTLNVDKNKKNKAVVNKEFQNIAADSKEAENDAKRSIEERKKLLKSVFK